MAEPFPREGGDSESRFPGGSLITASDTAQWPRPRRRSRWSHSRSPRRALGPFGCPLLSRPSPSSSSQRAGATPAGTTSQTFLSLTNALGLLSLCSSKAFSKSTGSCPASSASSRTSLSGPSCVSVHQGALWARSWRQWRMPWKALVSASTRGERRERRLGRQKVATRAEAG